MSDPAQPEDAGPLLVVISGPSCAGKDSVLAGLDDKGYTAHYTVTNTTRAERGRERFIRSISDGEFQKLLDEDGLLEHAEVYGFHYGVPKAQVRDAIAAGKDVIMRVDVQGAETIKKKVPAAIMIFLTLPSVAEIEERLRSRAQDEEESVQRRLKDAIKELDELPKFDYVVVNERDRLDKTIATVEAILAAEHARVGRTPVSL